MNFFPIGALTSKPYAFTARSWELESVSSVDVFDPFGSSIRLDIRNSKILRILPYINERLNEEWISDRIRFAYDGFNKQRIVNPFIRVDSNLIPSTWNDILSFFFRHEFKIKDFYFFIGQTVDIETLMTIKKFSLKTGVDGTNSFFDSRTYFTFSSDISFFEKIDFCLLVGCDIATESPILQAKLGPYVRKNTLEVGVLGSSKLSFSTINFGNNVFSFIDFLEGRGSIAMKFSRTKNPVIIFGSSVNRYFSENILRFISRRFKVLFLSESFGKLHSKEISFGLRGQKNKLFNSSIFSDRARFFYFVNCDNVFLSKKFNSDVIIYQGSHGFRTVNNADLVLPSCLFIEKTGSFKNLFGMIQKSSFVTTPPNEARTDWKIVSAIFFALTNKFLIENFSEINNLIKKFLPNSNQFFYDFSEFSSQSIFFLNFFERTQFDFFRIDSVTHASRSLAIASLRFYEVNYKNFF